MLQAEGFQRGTLAIQIGNIFKRARIEKKISQTALSSRTQIQRPLIARIESGKHLPNISTLIRMARGLEINPGRVLERALENVALETPVIIDEKK